VDVPGVNVAPFPALICGLPGDIGMQVNDKAPDFTLQDENGKDVALKDLRAKTVILFFYPRANTPG
jgi:peroxiredoxin